MTTHSDGGSGFTIPDPDLESLQKKYRLERHKRLRVDGSAQYVAMETFEHYLRDPFTPYTPREPVSRSATVAILGGGFSGLMAGGLLRKLGDVDLVIIEDGGDFGGTWYWNRYPGARCDVESHIYLPMLEEVGHVPSERYVRTTESYEHARKLGEHFDLYKDALFQTRATKVEWRDDVQSWLLETDRGDTIDAQFVILASGQLLSRPKLPGIPGIESFRGKAFHTSRWDYDYTGGDTRGNLHKLADKRVGIIGTGATAVQAIPHLAETAQHLYVFQRTPSIIDFRGNRPTDPEWAASLGPGWQQERMSNFDLTLEGRNHDGEVLVDDQWHIIWGRPDVSNLPEEQRAAALEKYDFEQMERIRRRVDDIVHDPQTAEALKPYYSRFCKRPCFNDEYLETFNRPNVTLVHTDGSGPDRITENAVWFDGKAYEIDCLIYATGFESFSKTPSQAGRYAVIGRNGLTLDEKWGGNDFSSVHGICTSGFPNMFVIGSSRQSATSFNIPHRALRQADHAVSMIAKVLQSGSASMEVTPEAELAWADVVASTGRASQALAAAMRECTPSYYNNEGKLGDKQIPIVAAGFGGGTQNFIDRTTAWREERFADDVILRSLES
ncbi:flavin-containing monooxygenase [Streptomyces canus]|uniref:flavin-containing monooxygenase n=1 Tax=Streptomyces canus TaxID=58343 RepID=UPI0036B6B36C